MSGASCIPGSVSADPGEELRYQATSSLDPEQPAERARLVEHLSDPSWRVRMASVDRLVAHRDAAAVLPALLEVLGSGESPGARNAAAAALTRIGAPAVPALVARLGEARPESRGSAAEVLGDIGDRRAVPALAGLLADGDGNVRAASAEALGKIGGPEAARRLLAALGADDTPLRLAALDALERLRVAPPVARLANLAGDRALRRPAFRLLGFSDEPEAPTLLGRGLADPSRAGREAALMAVAHQRSRRSPGELAPVAAVVRAVGAREPALAGWAEEALRSEDHRVAAGALAVLEWLGDARRAPAVAEAGEHEELRPMVLEALRAMGPGTGAALAGTLPRLSPLARATAHSALARQGDSSVLPALLEESVSEDEAVRLAAMDAMAHLGDLRAAGPLSILLDHPDGGVSGPAAAALAELALRDEAARLEVLSRCRPHAQKRVPAALLRLLGQIGGPEDLPLLRRSLRDQRPATRTAAAQGLEAAGARGLLGSCPPEILDALDDSVPLVRAAAARALGILAQPDRAAATGPALLKEAVRELAAALHDGEPAVRAAAALALGRLGCSEQAGPLAQLATEAGAPAEVAAAAIRALAELGHPDPAVLERAARHPDPEVVKEAVAAAAAVPQAAGGELLVGAASHSHWDVRRAAARALAARGDPALLPAVRLQLEREGDPMVAEALAEAARVLQKKRPHE